MKYINYTQAYSKAKKTSKASRYNKTRLITCKPTDRNETLKKITIFMWRKPPQKKLSTTKQHHLHILK